MKSRSRTSCTTDAETQVELEVLDRLRELRNQIDARRGGRPMPSPEDMLRDSREARAKALDEVLNHSK